MTSITKGTLGVMSELTGSNLNAKVFQAFHQLAALEIAFDADIVYDRDRQRLVIRRALHNVKVATKDAPEESRLIPAHGHGEWPPASYAACVCSDWCGGYQDFRPDRSATSPFSEWQTDLADLPYPKRAVELKI